MLRYVIRRLVLVIPTLIGILTLVFILLKAIPGDPAIALAGDKATPEQIDVIREGYGLDRPLPVQYAYFIKSAVTLDFGRSLRTHQPVRHELRQFFGATIELQYRRPYDRPGRRHSPRRHRGHTSQHWSPITAR